MLNCHQKFFTMLSKLTYNDIPAALEELLRLTFEMNERLSQLEHSNPLEELLSIEEASLLLKLSKQTIYRYSFKGLLSSCKRGGRLYFVKSELINWIKEGKKPDQFMANNVTNLFIQQTSKRKNKNQI